MKTKTGIVLEIKDKIACIMTQNGEFEKVKISNNEPGVGEIYTGEVYKKSSSIKYFVSAASVLLCVTLGSSSYAYYNPVNSLVVKINNMDTKIQINKFNKIIKVSTTKEESDDVIKSLKLKHKDINDGLTEIVEASKGTNNHNLFVEIKTNTKVESKLNIEKFKETMHKESIDYTIDKKDKNENNIDTKIEAVKVDEEKIVEINTAVKESNDKVEDKATQNNKKENTEVNVKNEAKNETNNKNKFTNKNKETKNNKKQ